MPLTPLSYDPEGLPRELKQHYISATEDDIAAMLRVVGLERLDALYQSIPSDVRFDASPLPDELPYSAVQDRCEGLAARNRPKLSFLCDGLPDWRVPEITTYVAGMRNLTTAYTPYQPERSQGTLTAHWIYQCLLFQLTGFEAVNASLYDRATALYEAVCCAYRLARSPDAVGILVADGLYPGDLEVVETLAAGAPVQIIRLPVDGASGRLDPVAVASVADAHAGSLAAIAFPQVNSLGLLEDVDALADLARERSVRSIAVIDPLLLAGGGLKPPSAFGSEGVDIIVGEGQHLAAAPNFGGPGLGIFGVRHNADVGNDVRAAPGRYVGKALDRSGRECYATVLSTREQHIRKEKATSNICSNQAFMATLVGAALLARGDRGLTAAITTARGNACAAVARLTALPGVDLAFPRTPFFNEVVFKLPVAAADVIEYARRRHIHIGVDVGARVLGCTEGLLKVGFSDRHDAVALERLYAVFEQAMNALMPGSREKKPRRASAALPVAGIPEELLRRDVPGVPEYATETLAAYYRRLGELNVSPDDACYPLGSCTMKYNPYVNDWAADLSGFTRMHPQAPIEDAQGCLEVLYEVQEWLRQLMGLAAVATQPVAGAQAELAGLKVFQAAHRARGEAHRDVMLIPKSAHGTNFASAAMAGFATIVLLEANAEGSIDLTYLDAKLDQYGERIGGIMITNPNTSGIFEVAFKAIAERIHALGGYVYMDGANMNAIAGWVDLGAMGVDAVHHNLHKTWSIPHGGGGPGDAVLAVSEPLVDFLPGWQIRKENGYFRPVRPRRSIGSFHRHWGNFAHKVRCYAYVLRLGREGVRRMSAVAVLAARYLHARLRGHFATLPKGARGVPRLHEFILTLQEAEFAQLAAAGIPRAAVIPSLGKLFLDFGFHAPTVAFPEPYGMMIEPTESYTRAELDNLAEAVCTLKDLALAYPKVLKTAPHFTPVGRIDEVSANRRLQLSERLTGLPPLPENRISPRELLGLPPCEIAALLRTQKCETNNGPHH